MTRSLLAAMFLCWILLPGTGGMASPVQALNGSLFLVSPHQGEQQQQDKIIALPNRGHLSGLPSSVKEQTEQVSRTGDPSAHLASASQSNRHQINRYANETDSLSGTVHRLKLLLFPFHIFW